MHSRSLSALIDLIVENLLNHATVREYIKISEENAAVLFILNIIKSS